MHFLHVTGDNKNLNSLIASLLHFVHVLLAGYHLCRFMTILYYTVTSGSNNFYAEAKR